MNHTHALFGYLKPEHYLDFVKMDEWIQMYRAFSPYGSKAFEDFIYLKSDMTNIKTAQHVWLQQMTIAKEMSDKTSQYMQESFHLMEKSMLLFMENIYSHHRTGVSSVNK